VEINEEIFLDEQDLTEDILC